MKLFLPKDCINMKVVNFSSCYFLYINDLIALFSKLTTLVRIDIYINK